MLKYHIQTIEVGSGGAGSLAFNNIPQDYDDLCVVFSLRSTRNDNSDSAVLSFNGVAVSSNRFLFYRGGLNTFSFSITNGFLTQGNTDTANTFSSTELVVQNYSGSGSQKPISFTGVTENNASLAYQNIGAGLTPVTQAITSISVDPVNGDLMHYSSASLYGIKRGSDGKTETASGGVITQSGGYTIHTFNTSGTFVANRDLEVEYLVVAGGGGGGGGDGGAGGGGGAGGYRCSVIGEFSGGGASAENKLRISASTSYAIAVGAGGAGGTGTSRGVSGSSSVFSSISSTGGGGGAFRLDFPALTGGSGGGAPGTSDGLQSGASGTPTQGFAGGSGTFTGSGNSRVYTAGGGGGGGAVGTNAVGGSSAGSGGNGVASSITGSSVSRAGGGGGASGVEATSSVPAGGATAGGGAGGQVAAGTAGTANTGGGGGGGGYAQSGGARVGAAGGSGVVIIRYLTPA
jgi:hypothetical protein